MYDFLSGFTLCPAKYCLYTLLDLKLDECVLAQISVLSRLSAYVASLH